MDEFRDLLYHGEEVGVMCPVCHGYGEFNSDLPDVAPNEPCDECDGTGLVYER